MKDLCWEKYNMIFLWLRFPPKVPWHIITGIYILYLASKMNRSWLVSLTQMRWSTPSSLIILSKRSFCCLFWPFEFKFLLNCLPKGRYSNIIRNFLKRRKTIYIHNDMITSTFLNLKFPLNKEDYFHGKQWTSLP